MDSPDAGHRPQPTQRGVRASHRVSHAMTPSMENMVRKNSCYRNHARWKRHIVLEVLHGKRLRGKLPYDWDADAPPHRQAVEGILPPDFDRDEVYRQRINQILHRAGSVDQYFVRIWWSDDDGRFLAAAPQFACAIADGATRAEALAALEVVVREWIETARQQGRAIPNPRRRSPPSSG
jgi:predicted RNase H-like HicB family nuclease